MTQLNLSGRQSNNSQQKPAELEDESIKNQTVGALGALAMFAAVIVIGSCSTSKPVAVQQPVQSTTPAAAPAPTVPVPTPAPAPVVAKAKKHRAATLSYVNREYGLSFNFPRTYQLKTQLATQAGPTTNGNETPATSATAGPLPMNFVHPGGMALAAGGDARQLVSRNELPVRLHQHQRESRHDRRSLRSICAHGDEWRSGGFVPGENRGGKNWRSRVSAG